MAKPVSNYMPMMAQSGPHKKRWQSCLPSSPPAINKHINNIYDEMAVDCLAGYLHTLELNHEPIPAPTPLDKVAPHCEDDEDEESDDASIFVSLVSVDVAT